MDGEELALTKDSREKFHLLALYFEGFGAVAASKAVVAKS